MATHTEIEALRQVAFPDFPHYRDMCESEADELRDGVEVTWICTRQPGHDGPHMATYDCDGDGEIIGYAWTDNA